jgi:monofunctional biosynthetic peptidoglycan transglycosylase
MARSKRKKKGGKLPNKPIYWWLVGVFILLVGVMLFIDLSLQPDGSEFKAQNPKQTSLMRIRAAPIFGSQKEVPIRWIPIGEISPHLVRAVIVAEDANFYGHKGIDHRELWAALSEAMEDFEMPRGASTITQQLAKNLYLSESKTPLRKLREVVIAKSLEENLGKKRILEIYLNVIEWGPQVYGAEAASLHYFGKSANSLSKEEAAFLAAIIPGPLGAFSPVKNLNRVKKRQSRILKRM